MIALLAHVRLRVLLAASAAVGAAALVVGLFVVVGVWRTHRSAVAMSVHGTTVLVDTAAPSRVYLEYGRDRTYGLFTRIRGPALSHRFEVAGVDPGSRYHVRAVVRARGRTFVGPDAVLSVPAGPSFHALRVAGDHLLLDGRPWIPRFTWGSCASDYATEAALGINAFMSSNCGDSPEQQAHAALQVGGLVIPALDQARRALPTTIATYLVDEPDIRPIQPSQLAHAWSTHPNAHGLARFLTFSAQAATTSSGDAAPSYAGYARLANVLGIDVYPISSTGDPNQIVEVATAQRALRALAGGKPTFQWIEATLPSGDSGAIPTPAEIEAEAWLAIINGARALGWWTVGSTPFSVSPSGRTAIRDVDTALDTFAPAIDAPTAPVTLDNGGVDVFATSRNGAITVFAVNTNPDDAVYEVFNVPGIDRRPVKAWNTGRTVRPTANSFADTLPALAWRIYLIPPH